MSTPIFTRPPEVKASTGITYENFSQILEKLVRPGDPIDKAKSRDRYRHLFDSVYSGIRLQQWQFTTVNVPAEPAYEIWNIKETIRVLVTQKTVEIMRGLMRYSIADGMDAAALFNGVKHAQEAVQAALARTGAADVSDEEFFKPLSEEEQVQQMDAVLSDNYDPHHSAAANQTAEQEASEVQTEEYPLKADPKQQARSMSEDRAQRHLKSLQGRVLTIMEAAISDKSQRDAVKTLVNKEFRREMEKVGRFFLFPEQDQSDEE